MAIIYTYIIKRRGKMKIKELINKLEKCDEDAEVAWEGNAVEKLYEPVVKEKAPSIITISNLKYKHDKTI